MNLVQVTPPSGNIVSVSEVKSQIRVTASAEDTLITAYIKAAEALCENITGRKFLSQVWDMYLHTFPGSTEIKLPFPKLKTLDSFTYYDAGDVLRTLVASTDYYVDDKATVGAVYCAPNKSWPSVSATRPVNNVILRFTAGWDTAAAVPEEIKRAVIQAVGYLFENREDEFTVPSAVGVPRESNWLLTPWKCYTDF